MSENEISEMGTEKSRREDADSAIVENGRFRILCVALFLALVFSLACGLWTFVRARRRPTVFDWAPLSLDCEGTTVRTVLLSESPRIVSVEGFLTDRECRELRSLGEPKLKRSTVQGTGDDGSGGTNVVSRERTSWTANLVAGENEIVRRVERRAALLAGYPVANLEPLQIVRYEPGQQYKRHFDYFVRGTEGSEDALRRGGQRRVTIFAYLNDLDPDAGGETHFTELNLKVSPKKGCAVLFHDCTPDGKEDPRTAHAGSPPKSGVKYGCNVWIREAEFH